MRKTCFKTEIFRTPKDIRRGEIAIKEYLSTLFVIDVEYLKDYPDTPRLYEAGIVYRKEPVGLESWKSIPVTLVDRFGDCEDLACWRAAELNVFEGVRARPKFILQDYGAFRLYHIIVEYPNGQTEDPSKILGMK